MRVVDPATGIASKHDRPPTVKELTDYLRKTAMQDEIISHYGAMPRIDESVKRIVGPPPRELTNLFVPEDNSRYAQLLERHEADPKSPAHFERREMSDKVIRLGIWVPLSWWEDGKKKIARAWDRPVAKGTEEILEF